MYHRRLNSFQHSCVPRHPVFFESRHRVCDRAVHVRHAESRRHGLLKRSQSRRRCLLPQRRILRPGSLQLAHAAGQVPLRLLCSGLALLQVEQLLAHEAHPLQCLGHALVDHLKIAQQSFVV